MKKNILVALTIVFTIVVLTTIFLNSCTRIDPYNQSIKTENMMYGWTYIDATTKYRIVQIDGHEYLVVKKDNHGGVSVIHSESCSCKK